MTMEVEIYLVCPSCGEEVYPTMILFSNGKCPECGIPLPRRTTEKCCYHECCKNFPNCPSERGNQFEDWSCLEFSGEPR